MNKTPLWTKCVIGLDMDGVIIDHTANKIAVAKRLGYELLEAQTPSDITAAFIPEPAYGRFQQIIYDDPVIALSPPPYPGVLEGLRAIKASGTPYFLISRRKNPPRAIELLKKRGLWPQFIDEDNFISEKNAFFVLKKKDKDDRAKALGVNVYIDDQPSVLAELASVPDKFLFDPLGVHAQGDYTVVRSWPEFLSMLKL